MLRRRTATADHVAPGVPSRRDRGVSFLEVLVTVVLLGLAGVATLTALTTSIRGSDQHKSKVAALSELQGAGAYLQREANELDCATETEPTPQFYADKLAGAVSGTPERPGARNEGVTVSVASVDCSTGLPVVSLRADHSKGNATEELDVVVGGVSVDKPGTGTGGPAGPGGDPCSFQDATATPIEVNKVGNGISQTVTIRLQYTGDCSSASASAFLSQSGNNPPSVTLSPMTDSGSGYFEATLPTNAVNWKKEIVNVTITASSPSATRTTTFTVK